MGVNIMVTHSAFVNTIKNQLNDLSSFFEQDIEQVDRMIEIHLDSPVPLVSIVAKHLIYAGGKRLRPLLTLASYRTLKPDLSPEVFCLAAAVEFIHTATLLHDDVIDESSFRRGLQSSHRIWGNQASILAGDFLFSQAFQLMVQCKKLPVLGILSQAAAIIAEGEILQLSLSHDLSITQDDYLKIIEAKTATLFSAAMKSGAMLADDSAVDHHKALEQYGHHLGIAFQIVDDILDYTGVNGKVPGDDFREGKITLPIILATPHCTPQERDFINIVLIQRQQGNDDLDKMVALLKHRQGFKKAQDLANHYIEKACHFLDHFPESELQHILKDVALRLTIS